jgi:low temperature requirement protein LtrA
MANIEPGELLREPQEPRPIAYIELFFDLAFIFALTELTRSLVQDITMGGVLRSLVLLAAIWWVWSVTAWSTDWFDPNQPFVRALLTWVMLGGLLLAAAVPKAFDQYAMAFAGTYLAIHLGRGAMLRYALRGHPAARRSQRVAVWFAISGVAWVTGALVPAAQLPLWAVAVVVDATIPLAGYPVPRLGRSTRQDLQVSGAHLTERFAQLVIVAVGELILVSGLSLRDTGFHPASTVAFILAFVTALLFTQIYYLPVGRGHTATKQPSSIPGDRALLFAYLHFVLLAAILTAAAGHELMIAHSGGAGRERDRVVLVAGVALFLAWRTALLAVKCRRTFWWLPVGLVVAVAALPGLAHLPPVAASVFVNAVLLLVGLAEGARSRREQRQPVAASA